MRSLAVALARPSYAPCCRSSFPRRRASRAEADQSIRRDRSRARTPCGLRAASHAAPFQSTGPLDVSSPGCLTSSRPCNARWRPAIKGLKTDNPMAGAVTLAALSFLYGILHAVGPGHGKTIISSYVVANEETVRRRGDHLLHRRRLAGADRGRAR